MEDDAQGRRQRGKSGTRRWRLQGGDSTPRQHHPPALPATPPAPLAPRRPRCRPCRLNRRHARSARRTADPTWPADSQVLDAAEEPARGAWRIHRSATAVVDKTGRWAAQPHRSRTSASAGSAFGRRVGLSFCWRRAAARQARRASGCGMARGLWAEVVDVGEADGWFQRGAKCDSTAATSASRPAGGLARKSLGVRFGLRTPPAAAKTMARTEVEAPLISAFITLRPVCFADTWMLCATSRQRHNGAAACQQCRAARPQPAPMQSTQLDACRGRPCRFLGGVGETLRRPGDAGRLIIRTARQDCGPARLLPSPPSACPRRPYDLSIAAHLVLWRCVAAPAA